MPRVIFISPYFKSNAASARHLSYLVHYIATREGVSPVPAAGRLYPASEKQSQLVSQMVKDFPMAKKQFEYADYQRSPTRENADDFIRMALEQNFNQLSKRQNYVDYIGTRPGVAKLETHGLFDCTGRKLVISQVQKEIAEHPGIVWTPVISLRREDAHAMGLESPESWRALLSSCASELAKSYRIRPEHLRWYAAFHDNSHHPHVHMILYSTDPSEGFLTKQGITQIKSVLAQRIFPEKLQELYAADTKQRDALKAATRARYQEVIRQMLSGTLQSDRVELLTAQLVEKLTGYQGKMQYGYLQAPVKAIVDEIVDELAKDPRIAEAYDLWFEIRSDIYSTYQDGAMERPPISKQKEFKPIRNMVIAEAARFIGAELSPSISAQAKAENTQTAAPLGSAAHQPSSNPTQKSSTLSPTEPATAVTTVTRLLHHMGRIFQDNTPPVDRGKMHIDKKLRQKIRQKKIAQGHKADDHEDFNMTM